MIQGSNQARTARSATGQRSRGRRGAGGLLLFPRPASPVEAGAGGGTTAPQAQGC